MTLVQPEPFDWSMLPAGPGEEIPVPPFAAATTPLTLSAAAARSA